MSASHPHAHDLPRGDSLLPAWVKDAVRSILDPIVNIALALHITANMVTVLGLVIVVVAALLIGSGSLVAGALILMGGSLLDAVDGALAEARAERTLLPDEVDSPSVRPAGLGVDHHLLQRAATDIEANDLGTAVAWPKFQIASIGVAPRTERLVLIIAGLGLAGLGIGPALIAALWIIAALTVATTAQRIWHVWRLTASTRG